MAIPTEPTNFSVTSGAGSNLATWDNVIGATLYNLYWKKDKCPNCYFTNLDDWDIVKLDGTETATIVAEKLRIYIPNLIDGNITLTYDHALLSGDFTIIINFSNYVADDSDGFRIYFGTKATDDNNNCQVWYRCSTSGGTGHLIRGSFKKDGNVTFTDTDYPATIPTKIRIRRVGTTLYADYYNGSWVNLGSLDFESFASFITTPSIFSIDEALTGGTVDVDNLIITPSVKDSGTKIIGVTSPYRHIDLIEDDIYCYEITAENIDGESEASLEEYGIPTANIPAAPIITGINGDSQNTITIPDIYNATIYNIYWSLIPGVTVNNGTKMADVTSPYEHIDLIRQNYYYIATAENDEYESVISNGLCLKPDFDGKIFNHNDIIKSRLLYQYKIKE